MVENVTFRVPERSFSNLYLAEYLGGKVSAPSLHGIRAIRYMRPSIGISSFFAGFWT